MAAKRKALCGCGCGLSAKCARIANALLETIEALSGINAALQGENRRAWSMVRRLEAEHGADGSDSDAGAADRGVGAVDRGVA